MRQDSIKLDLEIGATFNAMFNDVPESTAKIVVVEGEEECDKCVFNFSICSCMACEKEDRADKKDVYFKVVK